MSEVKNPPAIICDGCGERWTFASFGFSNLSEREIELLNTKLAETLEEFLDLHRKWDTYWSVIQPIQTAAVMDCYCHSGYHIERSDWDNCNFNIEPTEGGA